MKDRASLGRVPWVALITVVLVIASMPQPSTAQITVTTTQQGITDPTNCSLQEAIYAADFGGGIALDQTSPDDTYYTGCTDPTNKWDTIVLPGGTFTFDHFWDGDAYNPFGPTVTPIIFKTVTIQGNGTTLRWIGAGYSRLFAVGEASITPTSGVVTGHTYSGTGNVTLYDVFVQDFKVKGGDGVCGGGGGLGAGGAIYVGKTSSNIPSLTVINSTFQNNSASGGNGSAQFSPCGMNGAGGGGGVYGKGGSPQTGLTPPGGFGSGSGGGGGARGNGGSGFQHVAGGGGGTVFNGGDAGYSVANGWFEGAGGGRCGGQGGTSNGTCPGGGGGGADGGFVDGGGNLNTFTGYDGAYGGGGGGGGGGDPDVYSFGGYGGKGGFGGGGGGGASATLSGGNGGNGGFGGGGGAGGNGTPAFGSGGPGSGGNGGAFAGAGSGFVSGGGGALGGAIFNDSGAVVVQNSTFTANAAHGGLSGDGANPPAEYIVTNGEDAGGAIFSRNGSLTVQSATISGNSATANSTGGGVVVMNDSASAAFTLDNTIIANNGTMECYLVNSVALKGADNLIMDNSGGCPGVAVSSDPQLGPLQLNTSNPPNSGDTPTMALATGSPAIGAGDASLNTTLPTDQRGVQRKQAPDIGAYETPPPSADLSIVKTAASAAAVPGDTVTYSLAIHNAGPNTAESVSVSDTLPAQLTYVSCTENTGNGVCTFSGGTVSVAYTDLANGASSTVTINSTLNSGAQDGLTVGNNASVSASSPTDPNGANNNSTAYFTVHNRADLAVTKSVSSTSPYWPATGIEVGDPLTYTVTLTNKGPYDARGVSLTDSAPAGVTFTGCTSTAGTCIWSGSGANLNLTSLANAANVTVTIQATLNFGVADGSTITNSASVTSTTFDPDLSSNSASASFTALNNSDLYVFQSATKLTNRQLRYTVNVKNLGKYIAKQLVLTDPTPSGSYFVSIMPGPWTCSTPPVGSNGTISCLLNTEAMGTTQTMVFVVKVTTPGSVLVKNTASVSAATNDPNPANNASTLNTKVGP